MNERIREISEKAWDFVSDTRMQHQVGTLTDAFEKKFAELIVKECLGIYDKIDNGNQHLGTDDYPRAVLRHFDT